MMSWLPLMIHIIYKNCCGFCGDDIYHLVGVSDYFYRILII